MQQITFYLDFVSPYAFLAFEQFPEALVGISHSVRYQPVLLGALLKHHDQLGPAEVAPKREWLYRHVQWLAHSQGASLQLPASHPFNSLPLLRLALACSPEADPGAPSRYVCETIFRHVWQGGLEAVSTERLQSLTQQLAPRRELQVDAVKAQVKEQLKANTDRAIAAGVFGVPTFSVDGQLFWGLDALPMLRAFLQGDAWFDGPGWDAAARLPRGLPRQ